MDGGDPCTPRAEQFQRAVVASVIDRIERLNPNVR